MWHDLPGYKAFPLVVHDYTGCITIAASPNIWSEAAVDPLSLKLPCISQVHALEVTSMVGKLICQHVLLSVIELKCRQHEAELRQSREECWAREQELAASREKLAHLKTTLEDRRKDMVGYKVTAHAVSSICGHVTSASNPQ